MNRSCLFEVYGQTEKYIYHVELSKTQRWPNGIKRQQHWRLVDRHTIWHWRDAHDFFVNARNNLPTMMLINIYNIQLSGRATKINIK